jgi:hypothetical protein
MFDSFVTWASANPYLSLWVQGLGMVVAALIALVAASLAFAGASAQAKAARDIAETDRREATRSLALVLLAELTDYEHRLESIHVELLSSSVSIAPSLPTLSLESSIYSANLASLGRLPSKLVLDVVRAYKLIDEANRNLMFIPMPLNTLNEQDVQKLVDQISLPIHEVAVVVRQLAAVAGVKLAAAQATEASALSSASSPTPPQEALEPVSGTDPTPRVSSIS